MARCQYAKCKDLATRRIMNAFGDRFGVMCYGHAYEMVNGVRLTAELLPRRRERRPSRKEK